MIHDECFPAADAKAATHCLSMCERDERENERQTENEGTPDERANLILSFDCLSVCLAAECVHLRVCVCVSVLPLCNAFRQ